MCAYNMQSGGVPREKYKKNEEKKYVYKQQLRNNGNNEETRER